MPHNKYHKPVDKVTVVKSKKGRSKPGIADLKGPGDKNKTAVNPKGHKYTNEKGYKTLGQQAAKAFDDAQKIGYSKSQANSIARKVQEGTDYNTAKRQEFNKIKNKRSSKN